MADELGLKVKFVGYFSDDVYGKLLPREKRILINANKPRYEHIFTMLHEFGHFVIHFKNLQRKIYPRWVNIRWKIEWLVDLCSKLRRYWRYVLNKESSKEWLADFWAMIGFILVSNWIGNSDDLMAFLNHHPEKTRLYFLALAAVIYGGIKRRIEKIPRLLLVPFRTT
jgi:hypothetical protein